MPTARLRTGVEIYYETHGEGEPLALVMGTSADHTYWGFQVPAFRERHRTIIYDSRGTGQSTKPADPTTCTMRVLAEDLKALLEHLGIAKAHVSGLSLGSTVAQELALAHPDAVATLGLHGTWARPDPAFVFAIENMKYPLLLGDYEGFVKSAFAWILSADFLNDDRSREGLLGAVLKNPHPPSLAGILGHIHADVTHDASDRLHLIRCPTLVTAGDLDIQVPPRLGRAVAEAIPGATYHLFQGPGSSHLACVERAPEWNRITLDWLAKHPIVA